MRGSRAERSRLEGQACRAARLAASRARVPYSRFRVGAVCEDDAGRLHAGCNVESASLGLTLCAERAAAGIAIARGARGIRTVWIYTPTRLPTVPCGACREILARLASDCTIVLLCDGTPEERLPLRRLIPGSVP